MTSRTDGDFETLPSLTSATVVDPFMKKEDFVRYSINMQLVGDVVRLVGSEFIVDVLSQFMHLCSWMLGELSA